MLIKSFSRGMQGFDVMQLHFSASPKEKFSPRPLVGVQGHWIKCVAQGYVDRWGLHRGRLHLGDDLDFK